VGRVFSRGTGPSAAWEGCSWGSGSCCVACRSYGPASRTWSASSSSPETLTWIWMLTRTLCGSCPCLGS